MYRLRWWPLGLVLVVGLSLAGCGGPAPHTDARTEADLVLSLAEGQAVLDTTRARRAVGAWGERLPLDTIRALQRHLESLATFDFTPSELPREGQWYAAHRRALGHYRALLRQSHDSTGALLVSLYVRQLEAQRQLDSLRAAPGLSPVERSRQQGLTLTQASEQIVGEDLPYLSIPFIETLPLPRYEPLATYMSTVSVLPGLTALERQSAHERLTLNLIARARQSADLHKQLELCRLLLEIERLGSTGVSQSAFAYVDSVLDQSRARLFEHLDDADDAAQLGALTSADLFNYVLVHAEYGNLLDARRDYRKSAKLLFGSYTMARGKDNLLDQVFEEGDRDALFPLAEKSRVAQQYRVAYEVSDLILRLTFRPTITHTDGRKTARLAYWVGTYYQRTVTPDSAEAYYCHLLALAQRPDSSGSIDSLYVEGLIENLAELYLDERRIEAVDSALGLMLPYGAASAHPGRHEPSVPYRRIRAQLAYQQKDYARVIEEYAYLTDTARGAVDGNSPLDDYDFLVNRKHTIFLEYATALRRLGRTAEALTKLDSAYTFQREILQRTRAASEGFAEANEEARQRQAKTEAERNEIQRRLDNGIFASVSVALVLLSLGFVVLLRNRKKILAQKRTLDAANKEIMAKSAEIENAYEEIQSINEELQATNDQLALKNTNIADSISYAKRIQNALLPEPEELAALFAEHSLLFKPRDVVSGDFYWAFRKGDDVYWAVADCTGHGVPGAFMSIIGVNLLTQTVSEWGLRDPNAILQRLHHEVVRLLKQQTGELRDGMDIGLVRFDLAARLLQFAGAHHPLVIVEPGGMQVLRADRQGIGGLAHGGTVNFTVATQAMQRGARYYMTTDGYVDQFNATGRRKLGQSGFEGLLAELQALPLQRQAAVLAQRFEQWHGSYRQLDDVLVMGVSL